MRPRDEDGHFLSWDDALDLRYDPEALAAAVEGQDWAAWLLALAEWEEDTGLDAADFDDLDEFLNVAESEYPVLGDVEGLEAEYYDMDTEFEIAADSDRYEGD